MFTLTERITVEAANTNYLATIDLGSYVDVGDRQAIQVHSVDFIFQGTSPDETLGVSFGGDAQISVQVMDLNRGQLVFTDDRSLVASATGLYSAAGNTFDNEADMYPDNYGKGSDDGRYVVNDQLYLVARSNAVAAAEDINVTVRVNASIVGLTAKDFMAIAIQSTAADN